VIFRIGVDKLIIFTRKTKCFNLLEKNEIHSPGTTGYSRNGKWRDINNGMLIDDCFLIGEIRKPFSTPLNAARILCMNILANNVSLALVWSVTYVYWCLF